MRNLRHVPAAGSFEDELVYELSVREKNRDFARVSMMVDLVTGGLRVQPEYASGLLEFFEAELYQDLYAPQYVAMLRNKIAQKRKTKKEMEQRLAAMNVTDEDLKSRKPTKKKK